MLYHPQIVLHLQHLILQFLDLLLHGKFHFVHAEGPGSRALRSITIVRLRLQRAATRPPLGGAFAVLNLALRCQIGALVAFHFFCFDLCCKGVLRLLVECPVLLLYIGPGATQLENDVFHLLLCPSPLGIVSIQTLLQLFRIRTQLGQVVIDRYKLPMLLNIASSTGRVAFSLATTASHHSFAAHPSGLLGPASPGVPRPVLFLDRFAASHGPFYRPNGIVPHIQLPCHVKARRGLDQLVCATGE
mmetsp:Transcript_35605/g.88542  ORF Transcript_35605/g.88542 Transcript_35605/m.88542 type:complete len:245 (-) Transcript_35605:615-1349(-)